MSLAYIDTSAAVKLLIAEAESKLLNDHLRAEPERALVSSWLMHTELHCALGRRLSGFDRSGVEQLLEQFTLIDVEREHFIRAGRLAPLRAGDAIHLATAILVGADEIFTYDRELIEASHSVGLVVRSPGLSD